MLLHKRDDVGDKSILIGRADSVPENEIRSRFSREAPAAQGQNLLEPRHLVEQFPLDLYMADTYGIARGDMAERNVLPIQRNEIDVRPGSNFVDDLRGQIDHARIELPQGRLELARLLRHIDFKTWIGFIVQLNDYRNLGSG